MVQQRNEHDIVVIFIEEEIPEVLKWDELGSDT